MQAVRRSLRWSWCACSLGIAPLVALVCWPLAVLSASTNTDLQMRAMLMGALPVMTLAFLVQMAIHRRSIRATMDKMTFVCSALPVYMLAWFCCILATANSLVQRLPMIRPYTPAPISWWIIFLAAWFLLTLFGGGVYLLYTFLTQPAHGATSHTAA